MSRVFFISDLHLGHSRILEFGGKFRDGDDVNEHDHTLIVKHNATVTKRDLIYILGDVCMHKDISILGELNGRKILVRGNHDQHPASEYLKYFEDIRGICRYKQHWISHCPIHPAELRGKDNIHGHVHGSSIRNGYGEYDKRYINVCVEAINGFPIPYEHIKDGSYWESKRI